MGSGSFETQVGRGQDRTRTISSLPQRVITGNTRSTQQNSNQKLDRTLFESVRNFDIEKVQRPQTKSKSRCRDGSRVGVTWDCWTQQDRSGQEVLEPTKGEWVVERPQVSITVTPRGEDRKDEGINNSPDGRGVWTINNPTHKVGDVVKPHDQ